MCYILFANVDGVTSGADDDAKTLCTATSAATMANVELIDIGDMGNLLEDDVEETFLSFVSSV